VPEPPPVPAGPPTPVPRAGFAGDAERLDASADALTAISEAWFLGTPPAPGVLALIADDIRATARNVSGHDVPRGGPQGSSVVAHDATRPEPFPSASVKDALSRLAELLEATHQTLEDYIAQHLSTGTTGAGPSPSSSRE